MRRAKEGPAAWIAAAAAVVIIPVTIVVGLWSVNSDTPGSDPTGGSLGEGAQPPPAATETAVTGEACLSGDGARVSCADADAWLVMPTSHCDSETVSRALGADPEQIELQIETNSVSGRCVVAPTAIGKNAGATIGDLRAIRQGTLPARVLTCWQDADPRSAVPCIHAHHFEPAARWRLLSDQAEPESVCPEAVKSYVAGPVDSIDGALSTTWVTSQEQAPRFRCLVKSRSTLTGTVYRLSGRPLPTTAPG